MKRILPFLLIALFPLTGVAGQIKSTALEASHIIKATGGQLNRIDCYNSKASAQWILIMDLAALPDDGAVTLLYPPIYVPATSNFSLVFPRGLQATAGIIVTNSSTGTFTKTIGSADCAFYADFQ